MDLNTVEAVHIPTRRDEVWPVGPSDAILAGGTWLFSEPQPQVSRLIDITRLGWPPITFSDDGMEIAATCSLAEIGSLTNTLPSDRPDWPAAPLFGQCCAALLASFKILGSATVGGNICLSFPAGAMISLASALDGTVTVWSADGSDYVVPIGEFVTGAGSNVLRSGDVLRSLWLPAHALRSPTAFRKLAPSPLGRSGVVVVGRRDEDDGQFVLSVTAATVRPHVFRFPLPPTAGEIRTALAAIAETEFTRDAHGDPDWRRAVTLTLAEQIRRELT
ncbi:MULTISPECIES: FAD binding domain-containing protein [Mycolicibacterium]|jgi:CO/xanthine dehydrogenase FAD-binding subunit|uniref:Molybdopterin dehydrogenase, FAD-binding protein n=1 Tax=Mycolicibacterium vanbaalenii (strain DSM 7251 / JCM 13017 / BCRC 16820 / KCTC 9966 / NRRL B-24157 / PYR-1) TaxID=350058 RepID=A1TFV1_MYCVP|nr:MULTISPECIES: FAD binding domain-containing protein [Mycolicibacterium]ABM16051.1 molybdopterin dehydrogenase, FAD-binding protein [Mycolicibacterium vanbaalenii PYR-1]MCV7129652.1 FAD binding domain-containing protein [Mycolicibacterium vanbaalenii PYR-1]PQP39816.1 FAD-binding molybdopterin dehydrogenase [Mycolicibacterium austroafricanum]QZT56448.1 FAD binding domain-containing protein [Mycolicibacterium austroafricanum]